LLDTTFDFKNLNIDTNIKKIILLYGDSPCNTCYFGKQMLAIKNNKDIVIYVPNDYSNYDIKNLKIFYRLNFVRIIRGCEKINVLLKKISQCKNDKIMNRNCMIILNSRRRIKKIFL